MTQYHNRLQDDPSLLSSVIRREAVRSWRALRAAAIRAIMSDDATDSAADPAGPRRSSPGPCLRDLRSRLFLPPVSRLKRVGLLGGSFNPAHGGHRSISRFAIDALRLDAMWWLVSPGNPLKAERGMAPYEARLGSARKLARRSRHRGERHRAAAGHALHRRYAARAQAALSRDPLHLGDGGGQSGPVPPLEGLANHRADDADCGDRQAGL